MSDAEPLDEEILRRASDEHQRRQAHVPEFRNDIWHGLESDAKTLPCKWFYDETGAALFEAICELDEYYPTRTELAITESNAAAIAAACGPRCLLIEPGSGASLKTRILLDHLADPAGYVPVDISAEQLQANAAQLRAAYPEVPIAPVHADFTREFAVPAGLHERRRVCYFPGSTIGNFGAGQATGLLRVWAGVVGTGGGLLLGTDLVKDPDVLVRAYDDAQGITAAFNLNLLDRINRELDGDIDTTAWHHEARWNAEAARIEMYLVSDAEQAVRVAGRPFRIRRGEAICTEHCHKYTVAGVAEMAAAAGFRVAQVWTDPREWFALHYAEAL